MQVLSITKTIMEIISCKDVAVNLKLELKRYENVALNGRIHGSSQALFLEHSVYLCDTNR